MAQLSVLVSGGGIAGAVAAYWLARGGAKVLVVERSATSLGFGQGIDLEGAPREIARRMNCVEEMKARATGETGFANLDDDGKILAWIPGLLTSDIEIIRGDLTDILVRAADAFSDVEFQFGRTITEFTQTSSKVHVTFDNGDSKDFDVLIGADGIGSKTRRLLFDRATNDEATKTLDVYCAYFSIPREKGDSDLSTVQNAPGGRTSLIRPVNQETSSGFLISVGPSKSLEEIQQGRDVKAQKTSLADIFAGLGGQFPRVVEGMKGAENFYFERIRQIKLPRWSEGRVGLVGDAGYGPSPLTGQGTTLGVMGAYILAGELTKCPDDPAKAMQEYERIFRGFVEKQQKIPLGGYAPFIANPQSAWAIWLLRLCFRILASSKIWKLFAWKDLDEKVVDLPSWIPDYPQFHDKTA